jgi:hypothetical protein
MVKGDVTTITKPIGEVIAHIRSPFMKMRNQFLDWLLILISEEERRLTVRSLVMEQWKESERDLIEAVHEEFGRLVQECSNSEEKE